MAGIPEPRRDITLFDVAQRAGVSLATASKALNDRFDVSASTRDRVLKVAQDMGFSANALARGLAIGRSHTVGIVTNDLSGRFVPKIMHGAELAVGMEDSTVLMSNSHGDPAHEERLVRRLLERRVDGLIMVDDSMEARSPVRGAGSTPIVYAYGWSTDRRDRSIIPDADLAGRIAAQHLIDIGRRHIVVISGEPGSYPAVRRAAGARDALRDAGLAVRPSSVLFGSWSEQWGWDAIEGFFADGLQVDGVVAGDDLIARGVVERIQLRGLRIPDDIAVVGQDDWWPVVNGRLPITSVNPCLDELGAAAVRLLYSNPAESDAPELVPPRLMVRESTVRGGAAAMP
ncbi:MAG: LacI family DNA-binding transcriptional regulator [Propionicimonas sp.]|nr:LacI family DNA-binding transcriptional regulator [Propionicimonas sp.]